MHAKKGFRTIRNMIKLQGFDLTASVVISWVVSFDIRLMCSLWMVLLVTPFVLREKTCQRVASSRRTKIVNIRIQYIGHNKKWLQGRQAVASAGNSKIYYSCDIAVHCCCSYCRLTTKELDKTKKTKLQTV